MPAAVSVTGGLPPAQASRSLDGSPQPEITRYGRVDYYSPMDKDQEYPLRVGLLLSRHGHKLLAGARVKWATLSIAAREAEPVIRIIPSSGYFRISPPAWDLKVKKDRDVFADFRLVPLQLLPGKSAACDLQISFEYDGEIIHNLRVPVGIQEKHSLGPLKISHSRWRGLTLLGSAVVSLDTAVSLLDFFDPFNHLAGALVFGGTFLAALTLLGLGLVLWGRAGRRIRQVF